MSTPKPSELNNRKNAPIGIIGAGAFGTALAISLGRAGRRVILWSRREAHARSMQEKRANPDYLTDIPLPDTLTATHDITDLKGVSTALLCTPAQSLRSLLTQYAPILNGLPLIAACKGIDLQTLQGPSTLIANLCPHSMSGVLTGPSFAEDIAKNHPIALTLAIADESKGIEFQNQLSTPNMRLYRTTDVKGAELGGALKNIMAIGAGVGMGMGFGESARAAFITRSYAEIVRFATRQGARAETLSGLSGLGDLMLTCGSSQSRNFRYGFALGSGQDFDTTTTVEGIATANAVRHLARDLGVELPIVDMTARLIAGEISLQESITELFNRPLKRE